MQAVHLIHALWPAQVAVVKGVMAYLYFNTQGNRKRPACGFCVSMRLHADNPADNGYSEGPGQ